MFTNIEKSFGKVYYLEGMNIYEKIEDIRAKQKKWVNAVSINNPDAPEAKEAEKMTDWKWINDKFETSLSWKTVDGPANASVAKIETNNGNSPENTKKAEDVAAKENIVKKKVAQFEAIDAQKDSAQIELVQNASNGSNLDWPDSVLMWMEKSSNILWEDNAGGKSLNA